MNTFCWAIVVIPLALLLAWGLAWALAIVTLEGYEDERGWHRGRG